MSTLRPDSPRIRASRRSSMRCLARTVPRCPITPGHGYTRQPRSGIGRYQFPDWGPPTGGDRILSTQEASIMMVEFDCSPCKALTNFNRRDRSLGEPARSPELDLASRCVDRGVLMYLADDVHNDIAIGRCFDEDAFDVSATHRCNQYRLRLLIASRCPAPLHGKRERVTAGLAAGCDIEQRQRGV